jgi:hypothetical protein
MKYENLSMILWFTENLSMILWFTELYFKRKSEQKYFLKKHLFTSGIDFCQARPSLELIVRSLKWLLEPPCRKKCQ